MARPRTDSASQPAAEAELYAGLNPQQLAAVRHGQGPLLIVAGAGTGKTRTLVHRVAHLIESGTPPGRMLLLTFTRRAAAEMLARVDALTRRLAAGGKSRRGASARAGKHVWGGTFHAVATRLLRIHGKAIGLDPGFTIHDRADSEDLLDVVRTELRLARTDKRFPKKGTCLAMYSHCVNARRPIEKVLSSNYPWCLDYVADLKRLFQAYVDRKEAASVLDYDDLLLFWHGLLADQAAGDAVRARFDCVLVDEYQDTNRLQVEILKLLRPDGTGLTAVGDDAQSIYSFRAATVRNILDFPQQFPGTTVVTLEENYRSTQPILATTNAVIELARERFTKELRSTREGGERPGLVTCQDEVDQVDFVVGQILERREAGVQLRQQAVLFRASHHSILIEGELARRNVPFVKYGGLKFIETAHVKDLMSFLRLAENPRDIVSGLRVLMLLPGIGPAKARQLLDALLAARGDFAAWKELKPPAAAADIWPRLVKMLARLRDAADSAIVAQVHAVRKFYEPLLEERYDNAAPRLRDLEQLEQLAGRFGDRAAMLAELTLDPPASTADFAADPLLDEDYLILSTIHSAKGLEWDAVYVIHASDGNIPSDMSTKDDEQIEEERRLFYVALTRAKNALFVCFPQRYYHGHWRQGADPYGFAQLTRFVTKGVKRHFACSVAASTERLDPAHIAGAAAKRQDIRRQVRSLWT